MKATPEMVKRYDDMKQEERERARRQRLYAKFVYKHLMPIFKTSGENQKKVLFHLIMINLGIFRKLLNEKQQQELDEIRDN